ESELGFALFERTGRSARLNAKGRQTLTQAEELLRLYQNLGSPVRADSTVAVVSFGAIDSVQRSTLADVLARLQREWPACRARVVPGLSPELFNLVDAGGVAPRAGTPPA